VSDVSVEVVPSSRAAAWRVVLNPRQLFVAPVVVLFVVARDHGWIAQNPLWVLVGTLFAAQLLSSFATLVWFEPKTQREVTYRVIVAFTATAACIYATGWGAVLSLGLVMVAYDCIRLMGSRAMKPAVFATLICVTLGEAAVAAGWVKSLIPQPQGHGLAVLEAVGSAFLVLSLGWATEAEEESEAQLRRREERFRALVQHGSDLILVIDANSQLTYASPSITRVLGYSRDDLTWFAPTCVHPDDWDVVAAYFRDLLARPGVVGRLEARLNDARGEYRWMEIGLANRVDDPSVEGIVCNLRDVTDRKQAEAALERQAFYDQLTGLPNRPFFLERLERARLISAREGRFDAVLFCDVDRFKLVNDSLGHEVGDRLLVEVASRLVGCVRPGDTVGRFGGDEFTVLLEDVGGVGGSIAVAERIIAALTLPCVVDGRQLTVKTSIGIAITEGGRESPGELLSRADFAMYVAKENGRGGWSLFDPTAAALGVDRLEVEAGLLRALEHDELVVHFQPEYDLGSGRVVTVEALVRWEHPDEGLLNPGRFIPIAEESGLVTAIDRFVLQSACRAITEWQRAGADDSVVVSVNISPRFFAQPDAADAITRVLAEHRVEPRRLQLEITERTALSDVDHTIVTLQRLRRLGVRVAIDDFGTGYSSLGYLKQLPVDVVKLDRTFVDGIDRNSRDVAIVEAVITMSHALGLKVTAEGVERGAQADALAALGCDTATGWYWSAAVEPDAVTGVVSAIRTATAD
jgi:diguanylate cyclase (GGDEF)-like protein/PAS domain S-box-containing protein